MRIILYILCAYYLLISDIKTTFTPSNSTGSDMILKLIKRIFKIDQLEEQLHQQQIALEKDYAEKTEQVKRTSESRMATAKAELEQKDERISELAAQLAKLTNEIGQIRETAVKAYIQSTQQEIFEQTKRGVGRPRIDATKFNLSIRQESYDRLMLLKRMLPSFRPTAFINDAIKIQLDQVWNEHPDWSLLPDQDDAQTAQEMD